MATKVQSSLRLAGAASSEPVALSYLERETVGAVLDDTVHQLAVLGGIMPDFSSSAAAVEHVSLSRGTIHSSSHVEIVRLHVQVMGGELLEILEGQKRIEKQFRRLSSPGVDRVSLRETARGITTATDSELI